MHNEGTPLPTYVFRRVPQLLNIAGLWLAENALFKEWNSGQVEVWFGSTDRDDFRRLCLTDNTTGMHSWTFDYRRLKDRHNKHIDSNIQQLLSRAVAKQALSDHDRARRTSCDVQRTTLIMATEIAWHRDQFVVSDPEEIMYVDYRTQKSKYMVKIRFVPGGPLEYDFLD